MSWIPVALVGVLGLCALLLLIANIKMAAQRDTALREAHLARREAHRAISLMRGMRDEEGL